MSKIYSYAEYLKIAKVGDVVRAVKGKDNECNKLKADGSNTGKITKIDGATFCINDCLHYGDDDFFLELVSPRIPTWETLQIGDVIEYEDEYEYEDFAKVLEVGASGKTFLKSGGGDFERTGNWFHIEEAKKLRWTLVTPPVEEEVQEMTVEDVSKLVGKKVKIVE